MSSAFNNVYIHRTTIFRTNIYKIHFCYEKKGRFDSPWNFAFVEHVPLKYVIFWTDIIPAVEKKEHQVRKYSFWAIHVHVDQGVCQ